MQEVSCAFAFLTLKISIRSAMSLQTDGVPRKSLEMSVKCSCCISLGVLLRTQSRPQGIDVNEISDNSSNTDRENSANHYHESVPCPGVTCPPPGSKKNVRSEKYGRRLQFSRLKQSPLSIRIMFQQSSLASSIEETHSCEHSSIRFTLPWTKFQRESGAQTGLHRECRKYQSQSAVLAPTVQQDVAPRTFESHDEAPDQHVHALDVPVEAGTSPGTILPHLPELAPTAWHTAYPKHQ